MCGIQCSYSKSLSLSFGLIKSLADVDFISHTALFRVTSDESPDWAELINLSDAWSLNLLHVAAAP